MACIDLLLREAGFLLLLIEGFLLMSPDGLRNHVRLEQDEILFYLENIYLLLLL